MSGRPRGSAGVRAAARPWPRTGPARPPRRPAPSVPYRRPAGPNGEVGHHPSGHRTYTSRLSGGGHHRSARSTPHALPRAVSACACAEGCHRVGCRLSSSQACGRVGGMTKYVALLRGINVGGHAKIAMKDLRELFGALGFDEVQTYLQSGNVVFVDPAGPRPANCGSGSRSASPANWVYR
ncbi:DUF1697 domain-containing protein [Streptomyces nogalater]